MFLGISYTFASVENDSKRDEFEANARVNREIWWAINTVRNVGAISKSVRKKRASLVFASYEIIEFHEERGGRKRRVLSTGFRPSAPRFICSCQSQISTFDAYLLLSCLSHPLDRAVPACPPSPLLFFHSIRATVFDCVMPVEPYQMDALSSLFPISYSSRAFDRCQLWRFSFGWNHVDRIYRFLRYPR